MTPRQIFLLILGVDALALFLQTNELSISYYEASLLYGNFSFMQATIKTSLNIFGQNDFALRLPMIILHILSLLLLNEISKKYLDNAKDRLWLLVIFILLPGVVSSALLVSSAGLVIFGLLLFVYIYNDVSKTKAYLLLVVFALIDMKFLYLFISLSIYSVFIKNKFFLIFNILLTSLSVYLYGFDTQGLPAGHFLDSIGIYSAIFTPIVFVYIVYALYRRYLIKKIDMLWFISSVTFIISLILSFRQRIDVENFAPYLIVALPLAAKIFSSSYKVRLKMFRKKYKFIFVVSLIFLIFNTIIVLFNKELYLILDNPKKHFAYKMHIAKELATELKAKNIQCVDVDSEMSKRLRFYGVTKCKTNILRENGLQSNNPNSVTIRYRNRIIYSANVTKLNNK